jgi:hypothetical protein
MARKGLMYIVAVLLLLPFLAGADPAENESKTEKVLAKADSNQPNIALKPQLKIDPFAALTEEERAAVEEQVLNKTLRSELRNSRYRIFGINATPVKTSAGLRRYAYALIYDYSRNKTYNVVSDVTDSVPGKIIEVLSPSVQPPPSREEYDEAMNIVSGLERVQRLLKQPNVKLQESFPVDSPSPCDISRCVEIQVSEIIPRQKLNFLLLVTVDLSTRQVVEVREPKTPTSNR